MTKSYKDLIHENKELKEKLSKETEKLNKEQSKTKCYRCNGSGEIFSYWDGDTYCPVCSGSGRV